MKSIKTVVSALFLLLSMNAFAVTLEEYEDECRQYAQDAEIADEQLSQYLQECMESISSPEEQQESTEQDSNSGGR